MEFKKIAEYFDQLEKISSRIQLTEILSSLLRETPPEDIDKVVYIIQGKLWPDFLGMPEIGVAEKLLIKALSLSTNIPEDRIESLLKEKGDLGDVAFDIKNQRKNTSLTDFIPLKQVVVDVKEVYDTLSRVALAVGSGSRDLKLKLIAGLLKKVSAIEAKYIVRFVDGKLRVGIGDATIMDALSNAFGKGDTSRVIVERAYNLRADLGNIARLVVTKGIESLKEIQPEPGIPIRPMLAERLSSPSEILDKMGGKALVDYKYDGERGQIHRKGNNISIFSRRMENITHQYPDVVEAIKEGIKSQEFIIEGEIVPIDPLSGEMRPFQELMHRKRKTDILASVKDYPVKVYLFDLIYNNGKDYTVLDQLTRRQSLESMIDPSNEIIRIAESMVVDSVEQLEKYFVQAISEGAEGVMVKSISPNSIYQAGARGWLWIKLKRDYRSEMADTVDLVVIGALYGRGRRGGILSSLLLASYDPQTDTFQSVCKVSSGFSDADLQELQERVKALKREVRHPRVVTLMEPEVWLEPTQVVEVLGSELTLSPNHACCKDKVRKGFGVSIRFPRFIRWRDDKSPEDATTTDEILEMYGNQLKKVEENDRSSETQEL